MTLEKRVAMVRKIAEKGGLPDSFIAWADSAEYMLKTYKGTKHELQITNRVEAFLVRIGC